MRLYADGISYHLELHQSNRELPYLLIMHGFMGSGKVFSHLFEPLSEFCNPITIDLAGHGNTLSPADALLFSAQRQVAQVKSILDRLTFDNLFIYGYSMGGRLGFQILVNHPGYFKGAVIESSHCGIKSTKKRHERRKIDNSRADQIKNDYPNFLQKWMNMPLFHTPGNTDFSQYAEIMKNQKPNLLSASLEGFGAGKMPHFCDKLKQIQMPVTLLAGEYDKKYVKVLSSIVKLNPHFTFTTVPAAGHRVHADQPTALINHIKSTISNS